VGLAKGSCILLLGCSRLLHLSLDL
jgi:hypothetical protein